MKKNKFDIVVSIYSLMVFVILLSIAGHVGKNIYSLRKAGLANIELSTASIIEQTKNAFNKDGQVEQEKIDQIIRKNPGISYLAAFLGDDALFTAVDDGTSTIKYQQNSYISKIFYHETSEQTIDPLGRAMRVDFTAKLVNNKDIASFIENDLIIVLALLVFTILFSITLLFFQHLQRTSAEKVATMNFGRTKEQEREDDPFDLIDDDDFSILNSAPSLANSLEEEDFSLLDSDASHGDSSEADNLFGHIDLDNSAKDDDFDFDQLPALDGLDSPIDINFDDIGSPSNDFPDDGDFNPEEEGVDEDDFSVLDDLELPSLDDDLELPPLDDDLELLPLDDTLDFPLEDEDLSTLDDFDLEPLEQEDPAIEALSTDDTDFDMPDAPSLGVSPNEAEVELYLEGLLARAEENNQDMSVLCFENRQEDLAFENDAQEFFSDNYGSEATIIDDGFVVMLTNVNSSDASKAVRQFTEQMQRSGYDVACGISSKHERKIKAHLLLREAKVALQEAKVKQENRAVAFKPDLASYKNIFYL